MLDSIIVRICVSCLCRFQPQLNLFLPYLVQNVDELLPYPQGLEILSDVMAAIGETDEEANRTARWRYLLAIITGAVPGRSLVEAADSAHRLQELCFMKLRKQMDLNTLVDILPEQADSELVLPLLVQLASDEDRTCSQSA